jgi:ABC-type transporter Mla MlaB component
MQNKSDLWLKGELKKKNLFNKMTQKQNQKNEDQI